MKLKKKIQIHYCLTIKNMGRVELFGMKILTTQPIPSSDKKPT